MSCDAVRQGPVPPPGRRRQLPMAPETAPGFWSKSEMSASCSSGVRKKPLVRAGFHAWYVGSLIFPIPADQEPFPKPKGVLDS